MTGAPERLLIVDDDADARAVCRDALDQLGLEIHEASDGGEARRLLDSIPFSVVLSDIRMPGSDGMELLDFVRRSYPECLVILITGYPSVEYARTSMNRGAFDFVSKPFGAVELAATVARALEARRIRIGALDRELIELHSVVRGTDAGGESPGEFADRLCASLLRSFEADAVVVTVEEGGRAGAVLHTVAKGDQDSVSLLEGLLPGRVESPGEFLSETPPQAGRPVVRSMGCLFRGRGRFSGSMTVARTTRPRPFTPRDQMMLRLFSAQAQNQLEHLDLTGRLEEDAARLEEIAAVSGGFYGSLDTRRVLEAVVGGVRKVLDLDAFAVFLQGKDEPPLTYILQRDGMDEAYLRKHLSRHTIPYIGHEGFRTAWESARRETVPPVRGEQQTPLDWQVLPVGDQVKLRGAMVGAQRRAPAGHDGGRRLFSLMGGQAAAALANAYFHEAAERNYLQTIASLAKAVDAKDAFTHDHSWNIAVYSMALADYMNTPESVREDLKNAALLHDIGKIGIPESILNKPGLLSEEEMEIVRQHPDIGYRILSPVGSTSGLASVVRHHHERFDGGGYPLGLAGESIPFLSRILTVADSFDAMISDRIYRPSPGMDFAVSELRRCSGSQFDPSIVYAFLDVLSGTEIERLRSEYAPEIQF